MYIEWGGFAILTYFGAGIAKKVHLHPCVAILLRHAPGHRGRIMLSFYLWISFRFGPWAASWDNCEELGHLGGQLLSAIRGRRLGCSCFSSPASWEYVTCDGAESSTHLEIKGLLIVVGAGAQRPRNYGNAKAGRAQRWGLHADKRRKLRCGRSIQDQRCCDRIREQLVGERNPRYPDYFLNSVCWGNFLYGVDSALFVLTFALQVVAEKDEQFGLTFLAALDNLGGPGDQPFAVCAFFCGGADVLDQGCMFHLVVLLRGQCECVRILGDYLRSWGGSRLCTNG